MRLQFDNEFEWVTLISPSTHRQIEICFDNVEQKFRAKDITGIFYIENKEAEK